jgi:uncharacterized protein (UPF0297 family)
MEVKIMAELTYKVELTEEVKQKIIAIGQENITATLKEISEPVTRLNLLVGQIEGDVMAMVNRMQEARTIIRDLNERTAVLAAAKVEMIPAPMEPAEPIETTP